MGDGWRRMAKTVSLIGGPADGAKVDVSEGVAYVIVPFAQDINLLIDESDVLPIIGWDDWGPILKRGDVLQARYNINGNIATYEESGSDG